LAPAVTLWQADKTSHAVAMHSVLFGRIIYVDA
jgi:hypothetical protein